MISSTDVTSRSPTSGMPTLRASRSANPRSACAISTGTTPGLRPGLGHLRPPVDGQRHVRRPGVDHQPGAPARPHDRVGELRVREAAGIRPRVPSVGRDARLVERALERAVRSDPRELDAAPRPHRRHHPVPDAPRGHAVRRQPSRRRGTREDVTLHPPCRERSPHRRCARDRTQSIREGAPRPLGGVRSARQDEHEPGAEGVRQHPPTRQRPPGPHPGCVVPAYRTRPKRTSRVRTLST